MKAAWRNTVIRRPWRPHEGARENRGHEGHEGHLVNFWNNPEACWFSLILGKLAWITCISWCITNIFHTINISNMLSVFYFFTTIINSINKVHACLGSHTKKGEEEGCRGEKSRMIFHQINFQYSNYNLIFCFQCFSFHFQVFNFQVSTGLLKHCVFERGGGEGVNGLLPPFRPPRSKTLRFSGTVENRKLSIAWQLNCKFKLKIENRKSI